MERRYDAGLCATALLASASERFVRASPRSTSGMSYAQSVRTSGVGRSLHYADVYSACKSAILWMGSRGDASPSCGTFADSVAHIAVRRAAGCNGRLYASGGVFPITAASRFEEHCLTGGLTQSRSRNINPPARACYAWLRTDRLCVSAIRWSYPPRREDWLAERPRPRGYQRKRFP